MRRKDILQALGLAVMVFAAGEMFACDSCGCSVKAGGNSKKESKLKAQTTCPVMGGKIDKKLYVDVNGKRIYVCCKGCIKLVKADPAKYLKKLHKQGVQVESVKVPKK